MQGAFRPIQVIKEHAKLPWDYSEEQTMFHDLT